MAEARHCFGTFSGSGASISSVGINCNRLQEGIYELVFDQPYSNTPAVVGTQVFPNQTDSNGGSTKDNLVCVYVRKDKCKVKVGDDDGHAKDRDFSVIVLGI